MLTLPATREPRDASYSPSERYEASVRLLSLPCQRLGPIKAQEKTLSHSRERASHRASASSSEDNAPKRRKSSLTIGEAGLLLTLESSQADCRILEPCSDCAAGSDEVVVVRITR